MDAVAFMFTSSSYVAREQTHLSVPTAKETEDTEEGKGAIPRNLENEETFFPPIIFKSAFIHNRMGRLRLLLRA